MTMHSTNEEYERFREEWLMDITDNSDTSVEKGIKFSTKLICQWLDIGEEDDANEDFFINDGPGDGGIDIAYLCHGEDDNGISGNEGDTWYLIQSKYGTSELNILQEGAKIIDTLCEDRSNLSEASKRLVKKLKTFREKSSESDRLELVIATTNPLNENERRELDKIKVIGREKLRFAGTFDVKEVSVWTIWQQQDQSLEPDIHVDIEGEFIDSNFGLIVGIVPIYNLYVFLDQYRKNTGDLNQIYDENVRLHLGKNKINKGIEDTIYKNPSMFGVYNNGITVVVSDYKKVRGKKHQLSNPHIVNGCQTTMTIWNTLDTMYNSGGTGELDVDVNLENSCVIAKIVKVQGKDILREITKFTNSQTGVRDQDFLALEDKFKRWSTEADEKYDIFLEIQRGAWDAKKAHDRKTPHSKKPYTSYKGHDYTFELLKVYGAGWLSVPGPAWNKKNLFLPGGEIYEKIMSRENDNPFGVDDILAAYILKKLATDNGFGKKSHPKVQARGKTKYVFYFAFIFILSEIYKKHTGSKPLLSELTQAIINLNSADDTSAISELCHVSCEAIDEYMTEDKDKNLSIFMEKDYEGDFNTFLKSYNLGKREHSPLLLDLLNDMNRVLSRPSAGQEKSPSEVIFETSRTVENL